MNSLDVKIEEKAKEILLKFNIEQSPQNIEFVTSKIEDCKGGLKRCKVVSFDANGNQCNVFFSIKEMAKIEGIKYKTASNIIETGAVSRKTKLRYKKLSDLGNLQLTNRN